MVREVLILDDEKIQSENLSKALSSVLPNYNFSHAFEENSMLEIIENKFYNLAIVDLRMDDYAINGVDLINKILTINPFSKIIIVSAFVEDFLSEIPDLLSSGKIISVVKKDSFETWIPKLKGLIENYYKEQENSPNEINSALLQFYSEAKNEVDTYKKGEKLENFISLLFGSFGYKDISKRVIDRSRNEVDLIIRNEIEDSFLNKFGKYILIESKNKPSDGVDKNDFIQFFSKLENTNGLAELGILITSGYIGRNTYLEAMRTSRGRFKVLFLSNPEIEKILNSIDKLSTFKSIIDAQVKDN